jgi:cell division control protein 6
MVASKDGDARKAIKLLRKSGVIAEDSGEDMVEKSQVDLADAALETKRIMDAVESCSKHSKLVLYAVIDLNDKSEVATGDVYARYKTWCERFDVSSLTQRRISSLIEKLDIRGLVTAEIINGGRRNGRTRMISMNLEGDTLRSVQEKIEENFGYTPEEEIPL